MSELNLKPAQSVIDLIVSAVTAGETFSTTLHNAAKAAAENHIGVAHKVICTIYAEKIVSKDQVVQRNARLQFSNSLVCFLNANIQVEVAPPKEGKQAVFAPANTLTATQAKNFAADVRKVVEENEVKAAIEAMSAEQKLEAQKAADIAAQKAAQKAAEEKALAAQKSAAALIASFNAQFAFIISNPELNESLNGVLANHGFKLTKSKNAPEKKGSCSNQFKELAK